MALEQLNNQIARVVLRAPDIKPRTGEVSVHEVLFTIRPSWSRIGSYLPALPGGKIEVTDLTSIDLDAFNDPCIPIIFDQMVLAGMKAVEREILEELGLILSAGLLKFVDSSTNRESWTTFLYAANLEEKPLVVVNPDSGGTLWLSEKKLLNKNPRLLSGHLTMARTAIRKLSTS